MKSLATNARRLLAACAFALPLLAHADPTASAYSGQGNLAVFDPLGGSGGWVGEIDAADPSIAGTLPTLVSVVTFTVDPVAQLLAGSFQFTTAADLSSSLTGTLSASGVGPAFLAQGGQIVLDLDITGGSGAYVGASGVGFSILNYDPASTGLNNYTESGLLGFAAPVPEPAAAVLLPLGLAALRMRRRRPQRLD